MSEYWSGKSVVVTGASGFLGKRLAHALVDRGAMVRFITSRKLYDLRDPQAAHDAIYRRRTGEVLFHLAGDVGGIGDNIKRPAALLYNNVMINTNVINSAIAEQYEKVIALGSSCAYPSDAPLPFTESDYLKGEPEPTNAPYAYSKRLLLTHLQAAHTQYGLNYTYLILANLYGEGCETDPEKAHVIGALVRKFYEAKRDALPSVRLWGTGKAMRDFLYIRDAVQALLHAGEHEYEYAELNISTGLGFDINTVAHLIASCTGYTGRIEWDSDKPDGQAQRVLDPHRASVLLEWENETPLLEGVSNLVSWYTNTQRELYPA